MLKYHKIKGKEAVAELADDNYRINNADDILDLMAIMGSENCSSILIRKNNLTDDFFDLKTGVAGEILQKFSNYFVKAAIVGDFSSYKSKSLQDFIRESNRGNSIFFTTSYDSALVFLSGK